MTATIVNTCAATECAYNSERKCRALAITVGEPSAATCATYTPREVKGGTQMTVANVGACKASDCKHNRDLVCTAASVTIGIRDGKVSCESYAKG